MTDQKSETNHNKKFLMIGGIVAIVILVLLIVLGVAFGGNLISQTDTGSEIETITEDNGPVLSDAQKEFKAKLDDGEFTKSMLTNIKTTVVDDLSKLTDKELYGDAEIGFEILNANEAIILYDPVNDEVVSYRIKNTR